MRLLFLLDYIKDVLGTDFLKENSPEVFTWRGGATGVFVGQHSFRFEPSKITPGGTTFVQEENFSGVLTFPMGKNPVAKLIGLRKKTKAGWDAFNVDFKKWVEEK